MFIFFFLNSFHTLFYCQLQILLLTHQVFLGSTDVSPGPTIWLFTWRGTSRAGWPTNAAEGEEMKENKLNRMKQTSSPDQSLGGTVPEQSGGSVFQPKHAVLHHTETQCLRDLSLEKGALKVVCCNEKTNSRMINLFSFLFFSTKVDIHRKKNKKGKGQRVND